MLKAAWSHGGIGAVNSCRRLVLPALLSVVLTMSLGLPGTAVATSPTTDGSRTVAGPGAERQPTKPTKPKKPKPAKAPALSPGTAITGEPVVVTGRLKVDRKTKVQLQRRGAKAWAKVAGARAAKGGKYRFKVTAPAAAATYRVVAGKHRSKTRTLRVAAQSARLTMSTPVAGQADGTAVASFVPARAGRPVSLQLQDGAGWRDVASAAQSSAGTASLSVPVDGDRDATYRAVTGAWKGARETITNTVTTGVLGTTARIAAPASGSVVSKTAQVRVDPAGITAVTRVAVFAGGLAVGQASRQPDGSWLASVDTEELSNGRTDLTARIWNARGSRLVPSVNIVVANDQSSTGGNVPDGFRIDTVAGGLALPTSFAVIDEHRTLVTEKDGLVRLIVDGRLQGAPVLDLTGSVANWWDQGLIGIALDPDFATNGWFYLTYVLKRDAADDAADPTGEDMGAQRVARYTLAGSTASPASEHIVLGGVRGPACFDHPTTADCIPIQGGSHTIDDVLFLPDGSMLVSVGDGEMNTHDRSGAARSQNRDVLAGKVLRIDPATGRGLPDNPFYEPGNPGSNRSRVWAYGFRNPFRMTIGPDGDVYLADVGEATEEEIDVLERGGNYGWPCLEGRSTKNPLGISGCDDIANGIVETVAPVFIYNHFFVGSATGGVFYTGDNYPEQYRGRYFFGDYSYSVVWQIDLAAADPVATFKTFAGRPGAGGAVKFAIGPDGNIWYLSVTTGELRRIVYDPDGSDCPSDRFRGEYFGSANPAPAATPALTTCDTSLPTGPKYTPPPFVADGAGKYTARWTGHPSMAPGTYRVHSGSNGTMQFAVDGKPVADGETFVLAGGGGSDPTPEITLRLSGTGDDAGFHLSYEPVGTAPKVVLSGPVTGAPVKPGTALSWSVAGVEAGGAAVPAGNLTSTVSLLHFGSAIPHIHPSGTFTGSTGTFTFEEAHAPAHTVFRIDARATGVDGAIGVAEPIYVCLTGNAVGPCDR